MYKNLVIFKDGKDAVVLYPLNSVYLRMVTFHFDSWGDDTVKAAEDYIQQRDERAKKIASEFAKIIQFVDVGVDNV